jgi:hypothetical protein
MERLNARHVIVPLALLIAAAPPALMGIHASASAGSPVRVEYPIQTLAFADGGAATVYDRGGLHTEYTKPPAGFDPLTASAADLARYSIPARPAGGSELAAWQKMMRGAHFVDAPARITRAGQYTLSASVQLVPSGNWSGYLDTNQGSFYTGAQMTFTEPNVTSNPSTRCTVQQAESIWAGVGGVVDNTLYQAGTSWAPNTQIGLHQGFFEVIAPGLTLQQSQAQPFSITPSVGDAVYTSFTYVSTQNLIRFYFADLTTGASQGVTVTSVPAMGSSTAEWIAERPTYVDNTTGQSYYTDLANFGTANIASAYSQPIASAFPAANDPADDPAQNPAPLTMKDGNSVLADPGNFRDSTAFPPPSPANYNGGFPDNYYTCQTGANGT